MAAANSHTTGELRDPLLGKTLAGRFHLLQLLGVGGMGRVYKAAQLPLGRAVAVKVISEGANGLAAAFAEDFRPLEDTQPSGEHPLAFAAGERCSRMMHEAATVAQLRHTHTVTVFDFGFADESTTYIAMELLEGRPLLQALRQEGMFPVQRALRIVTQICRSLREAHGLGIVHRDLKPANVYLTRQDEERDFVKVLDFGLAKDFSDGAVTLTHPGVKLGSHGYMAPEQLRGFKLSPRTDIYAVGVIFYEMVTGARLFHDKNPRKVTSDHLATPPPPIAQRNPSAKVPPAIEAVIQRCLAKDPTQRYQSIDELLIALKRACTVAQIPFTCCDSAGCQSSETMEMLPVQPLASNSRHRRSLWAVAAVAAVAAVTAVVAVAAAGYYLPGLLAGSTPATPVGQQCAPPDHDTLSGVEGD